MDTNMKASLCATTLKNACNTYPSVWMFFVRVFGCISIDYLYWHDKTKRALYRLKVQRPAYRRKLMPLHPLLSDSSESFFKVCYNVIYVLCSYGQSYGISLDTLIEQLFIRKLRMCGRSRMYHKALHISYICKK